MPECEPQALRHEDSRRLIAHWEALGGGRDVPLRSDFDPLQVPKLLPNIVLVDRLDGEYRFRLVGTQVAKVYGTDVTGWTFSRVFTGDSLTYWTEAYDQVFKRRRRVFGRDSIFWQRRAYTTFEWVLLPLADPTGEVSVALVSMVFD